MASQSTMKNRSHQQASGGAIPWIPKTCLDPNELNSWAGMTNINTTCASHLPSEDQPAQASQSNGDEKEDLSWTQWSIIDKISPFCSVCGCSRLPSWKLRPFPLFHKCWVNELFISGGFEVLKWQIFVAHARKLICDSRFLVSKWYNFKNPMSNPIPVQWYIWEKVRLEGVLWRAESTSNQLWETIQLVSMLGGLGGREKLRENEMMRELMKSWKGFDRAMDSDHRELKMVISLMKEARTAGRGTDVSTYHFAKNTAGDVHMK